ncbi:calmodulin-like [Pecten maximus]|uniref:calmodulin-like n=1 Tax=Pecten maximus TaxID=6579 RepID=UPI001458B540|nr:calmodulin-like [Pecten maximus]
MQTWIYWTVVVTLVILQQTMATTLTNLFNKGVLKGLEKLRKRQQHDPEPASVFPSVNQICFGLDQLEAYKDQFSTFIDHNNDGKASFDEIKHYLQKYNNKVTDDQVRSFLLRRDTNGDGEVDFIPDYLTEMATPNYSATTAREWFDLEDADQDGYVTKDELIAIARNIGMSPEKAEETANGYYMGADTNGDRQLDWKEYSSLFAE